MSRHLEVVEQVPQRRAVIYLRVSTKEQTQRDGDPEGYSIPAQRDACVRRARTLDAEVVEMYVDRGESARSADRPELQRMLESIAANPVDYVIVHKVDRLARNRMDDVTITAAIQMSGAQLVSVTENIDETPSGTLLHGIMSSIAEFYSRNLAAEVQKGMDQKVRSGGTNGRAPIGYLNSRVLTEGQEVRTIALDPDRAPLIRAAFEAYASGQWSLTQLSDELNTQGLRSRATKTQPPKPMTPTKLQTILRNRYYLGVVNWKGVEYPGRHPQLVSPELFAAVGQLLTLRRTATERSQVHEHYLSGTLRCARCQSRMLFGYGRSKTGVRYPYYFCTARHKVGQTCDLPYLPLEDVERKIERVWARELIDPEVTRELELRLADDLQHQNAATIKQVATLSKRIEKLKRERYRWAEMAMAGTVPEDIAKEKQEGLANELDACEVALGKAGRVQQDAMQTLSNALRLLERCADAYARHDDKGRRLMNQACFTSIDIDTDGKMLSAEVVRQPVFRGLQTAAYKLQNRKHEKAPEDDSGASGSLEHVESSNYTNLVDFLRRYSKPLSVTPPLGRALAQARGVLGQGESGAPGLVRRRHKLSQRLSEAEQQAVIAAYESGLSATQTGAGLGVTDYAVRRVLIAQGVAVRQYALTSDEIARAVELYESGLSVKLVAEELGRAESSIQKLLVQAGVELRPATRRWKLRPEQIDAAIVAYQAGQSLVKISEGLPVGAEAVRRALRARGVVMRPAGHSLGQERRPA